MIKGRACLWLFMACVAAAPVAAQTVSIAAVVNEEVITSQAIAERRDLVMTMSDVPLTAENQQRANPRILEALINEALQLQEARRLSITVTDDEIEKAIAALEESRAVPPGSILSEIGSKGLSARAMRAQVRAEIAWGKVVQRKLRRNVTVSDDEIVRAQQAQAADPGIRELRIAALSIPIRSAALDAKAAQLAAGIGEKLRGGTPLNTLALAHTGDDVAVTPPKWVAEETLQTGLQQALRTLNPGDVSPPLRTPNAYQLLQLIDRRTTKPLADSTEIVLKDILLAAPFKTDAAAMQQFREQASAAQANPGSCMEPTLGISGTGAQVSFKRTLIGALPQELKIILNHLAVGEVSEPLVAPKSIGFVMLCEKIEAAVPLAEDNKKIRNQLFREKLELEAQKLMRDLRRDAFIDIKGAHDGA